MRATRAIAGLSAGYRGAIMPKPFRLRCCGWLLVATGACACTPAPQEQTGTGDTPRAAATPSGQAAPGPATYEEVKAALQGMHEDGLTGGFNAPSMPVEVQMHAGLEESDGCTQGYPCVLDLVHCNGGSEYLGGESEAPADGKLARMADIAFEVIGLQTILGAAGYPASTWQPRVSRYETEALAALGEELARQAPADATDGSGFDPGPESALHESLKRVLNDYRADHAPLLPEIAIEGGCGAGEIGIHVATSPANGRSRFIPVFHYRLCKVRGLDPDDPAACDYWKEPADGVLFDVAGDYQYRVDWPDGSKRQGKFSFTHLEDGQTV
ncbi:MAG: hypothetical protein EOP92_41970, partial [Lysobacteraceae bacterium]